MSLTPAVKIRRDEPVVLFERQVLGAYTLLGGVAVGSLPAPIQVVIGATLKLFISENLELASWELLLKLRPIAQRLVLGCSRVLRTWHPLSHRSSYRLFQMRP